MNEENYRYLNYAWNVQMKNERPKIPIDFCSQSSVIDSMEICMLEKNNSKNATFIEEDLRPESILLEFAQIAVKLTKKLSIDSLQPSSFNQTDIEPNKDDLIKLDDIAFEKAIEIETSLDNMSEFQKDLKFKEVPWILPKKNAFQTVNIVVSLFQILVFFVINLKKISMGDSLFIIIQKIFSLLFKTNQLGF